MTNDGKIRACLLSMKIMLTPHLETIQIELAKAKALTQKNLDLSTTKTLVNLAAELEV